MSTRTTRPRSSSSPPARSSTGTRRSRCSSGWRSTSPPPDAADVAAARHDARVSLAEETEAGSGPDDLPERIAARAGGERADAVREFARAYLRRLSGDASDGISEDDLAAEVLGAFAFASSRGAAPAAVRAFNPTREENGYEPLGSVLETNTDDLPFLVDSVTAAVESRGLAVVRLRHPIVGMLRSASGRIESVRHPRDAPSRESIMHFDLDRRLDAGALAGLERDVRAVL